MHLDAIVVKVRSDAHVVNRPVYIALGIDLDGAKHVLGLWISKGDEDAKYWLGVLTEIRTRLPTMCSSCAPTGSADSLTPSKRYGLMPPYKHVWYI